MIHKKLNSGVIELKFKSSNWDEKRPKMNLQDSPYNNGLLFVNFNQDFGKDRMRCAEKFKSLFLYQRVISEKNNVDKNCSNNVLQVASHAEPTMDSESSTQTH